MSEDTPSVLALRLHKLRSGTAARLAGLPATTLRVWERRYAVVDAPKAPNGQRLYGELDVQRLTLMKSLTGRGHPIGTIARLDLPALQALAAGTPRSPVQAPAARPRLVVVGRSAAQKLKLMAACDVVAVHDDLDAAEAPAATVTADLLLAHLPSLQPASAARLLTLYARLGAGALIVVYGYGAERVAESLRSGGAIVRRDPVSGRDLARLVTATLATAVPAEHARRPPASPRAFSDDALVDIAESPSSIACECLRHVAELVQQLTGFERYSADCVSRSPADAVLHRRLSETAGVARTMFEAALQAMLAEAAQAPAG